MPPVKVNLNRLCSALERLAEWNPDECYFDRESGEIISVSLVQAYDPDRIMEVEQQPERYLYIKPLELQEHWQLMGSFLSQIDDKNIREELEKSTLEPQAFPSFKNALNRFPQIRRNWMLQHRDEMERIALKWLKDHDIEKMN